MQSSMLEQLSSFRSQLEIVAEENKQLRHELTMLNQAAASRVGVGVNWRPCVASKFAAHLGKFGTWTCMKLHRGMRQ